MLLHDYFFYLSNQSINETHSTSTTMTHSPLFHSYLTLILSLFGFFSNLISFIFLYYLILKYYQRKQLSKYSIQTPYSIHILSHKKYRFLSILTLNDFILCFSSIISCLDEQYFSQSFIAHYHLCSLHILLWKFTLHFTPLLTIFILCRYIYISYKNFPIKSINTTTLTQFLCTDLCILIPFVIALAWSVDGLWLWGEINIRNILPSIITNHTNDDLHSTTIIYSNYEQQSNKFLLINKQEKKLICYLQTNDNIQFTTRLLHLIQADFVLLCFLHLFGFFLEIFLHIRLCCCLITQKLTTIYLHEQQLSIYILYLFICLTLTSFPFYFYRTIEILFDLHISSYYNDSINSRVLAQMILFGICFKPILYFILIFPTNILFRLKCYTNIQIETINNIDTFDDDIRPKKLSIERSQHRQTSLKLMIFYPKIPLNSRSLSNPVLSTTNQQQQSSSIDQHI